MPDLRHGTRTDDSLRVRESTGTAADVAVSAASAVLLAGGNSIVYAETQPGRFEIRLVKVGPILRDKIVILDGLKAGESVATAGNFLIDSQMQLAGKPSLIDPTRAMSLKAKAEQLQFKQVATTPIPGDAGEEVGATLRSVL